MIEKNTFAFLTMYTPYGANIMMNRDIIHIGDQEVKYLFEIDSKAKHLSQAPEIINFNLDGHTYKFTENEWAIFLDILQNLIGEAGYLNRFITV